MRRIVHLFWSLLLVMTITNGSTEAADLDNTLYLDTAHGRVVIELRPDLAPKHVERIKELTREGFYDGIVFHRVIEDFMAQTGDPTGTGRGGPGYKFQDEFDSSLKHSKPGIFSMANSGPATNGSQFFITHKATPWLDAKHSVFGEVTKGQDVVDAVQQGDLIKSIEILDSTDALFAAQKNKLDTWNAVLDRARKE